jgi:hypothetical protein
MPDLAHTKLDLTRGEILTGVYQHFKGNKYHIFGVMQDTESGDLFVVYAPQHGEHAGKLSGRRLKMFKENVENNKDAPDYKGPRFILVEERPAMVYLGTKPDVE